MLSAASSQTRVPQLIRPYPVPPFRQNIFRRRRPRPRVGRVPANLRVFSREKTNLTDQA
jgi:hypothetical protein